MPVAIFAGQQLLWQATTTQPLAAGAQQTISVLWPVDSRGDYEISVVLNNLPVAPGAPEPLTLCHTPNTLQKVVTVRGVSPTPAQTWYFPTVYR